MAEHCPLEEGFLYWQTDIPDVCRKNCELIWERAETTAPDIDLIDPECSHTLEFCNASLQKGDGHVRYWTILSSCTATENDVLNETYNFQCGFSTTS